MPQVEQIIITTLFTPPMIYALVFCVSIPAFSIGCIFREWSLGLAIACCLFASLTPSHDIPSILLDACAFGATFGLLVSYIPYWFKSWLFPWIELERLLQR